MTIKDLVVEIQMNTEWLSTTEGDEVECISIENLEGILNRIFNQKLNLPFLSTAHSAVASLCRQPHHSSVR
jgi:hypothetical protein